MNKKLWQKNDSKLHPLIESYTVGEDYVWDKEIILYDIEASLAHARGLEKINILSVDELEKIKIALEELKFDWNSGKIEITIQDEDCHTVIENYLVDKLGGVGKKIHTGRSRNDQVLVAMRIYMKDSLEKIKKSALELSQTFLFQAEKYKDMPMPGYSHTQQAMLSSVGHYYASFVESLLDDIEFLESVKKQLDKSPLGSAAGFGVSLPLEREFVADELDFAGVQVNSLYCQNSKGKFESLFLESLSQVMTTLNKFSTDMLLFTSQEFNFFEVDSSLTTGSSIMPHKKNLDVLEIVRGNTSVIMSNQFLIKDLFKNLMSGYNRDSQLVKKSLFESTKIVQSSLEVIKLFLENVSPKKDEIAKKINKQIFMADIANESVVKQGIPFRDAYVQAKSARNASASVAGGDKLDELDIDLQENLKSKVSLGAPGNLGLDMYKGRINNCISEDLC